MSSFTRTVVGLLALVVVFGLSCVPLEKPLTNETDSTPDMDLVGHWICTNNDETSKSWYVGRKPGADKTLELVTAYVDDETHAVVIDRYDLFTTKIDDMLLGTIRKDTFTALMLYEKPDDESVQVYMAKGDLWKQAVQSNQLLGRLRDDRLEVVTDTPENVRRFLKQEGKKAFDLKESYLTFKKVKK